MEPAGERSRPTLTGSLSAVGFFSIALGSMIGIGWVTALGSWLRLAGPGGAILAFALGGAVMIPIGLCYAELTAAIPVAGGEVAFAYAAHGSGRAFLVGWFLAFGYLSVSAFEAISIARVLGYLVPGIDRWPLYELGGSPVFATHLALAASLTGLIAWFNYRGGSTAARLQTILLAAFLLMTGCLVVFGLTRGTAGAVPSWFGESASGPLAGTLSVFVTAPFWFVGFDTIPQSAEEASSRVSSRQLAGLIVVSIVAATVFYALLIFAVALLGDWRQIASSPLATAEAFRMALDSESAARFVLMAALFGLLTSWNGFFLAGSRVLFSLGRGAVISKRFGAVHPRYGSPSVAVVFTAIATLTGAALGPGAMLAFVNVGSLSIALAFLGVCASTSTLRTRLPKLDRPYRIPAGRTVIAAAFAGAAIVLGALLIPASPASLRWPVEWMIFGALCVAGFIVWAAGAADRGSETEPDRAFAILGETARLLDRPRSTASAEPHPESWRE
ncbi:MAG: APC family permease [Bryobacteraceae bacterium]